MVPLLQTRVPEPAAGPGTPCPSRGQPQHKGTGAAPAKAWLVPGAAPTMWDASVVPENAELRPAAARDSLTSSTP